MSLEPEVDVPATTPAVRHTVGRDREHGVVWTDDHAAVEEPLDIRLRGLSLAVTMRMPGDDEDLVAGFLFTERVISTADDLDVIARYRAPESDPDSGNVMNVLLKGHPLVARKLLRRNFVASSSCGLCGKVTIDAIRASLPPVEADVMVPRSFLINPCVCFFPSLSNPSERFSVLFCVQTPFRGDYLFGGPELSNVISKPGFYISRFLKTALKQHSNSRLSRGSPQRGEERVPLGRDLRVGREDSQHQRPPAAAPPSWPSSQLHDLPGRWPPQE